MHTKRYEVDVKNEKGELIMNALFEEKESALIFYEKQRQIYYSVTFKDLEVFGKKQLH